MDNNHLSPFYNLLCIIKCERFFDQSINSNFSEKISWTIPIQILLCNLRVCFHKQRCAHMQKKSLRL